MENPQPKIHQQFSICESQLKQRHQCQLDDNLDDPFDQLQIFQLIRHINDPQYPLTLQQLGVIAYQRCQVNDQKQVFVLYTPTIPHCSMAQIIGLMIKVKLLNNLPKNMRISVKITPGTHVKQLDINKQINDKQRVAAATQNPNILRIIRRGFHNSDRFIYDS